MAKGSLEFETKVSVDEVQRLIRLLQQGVDVAEELNDSLGGSVRKTVALEFQADASGAKELVAVEKQRLSATDAVTRALQQRKKVEEGSLTSLRQQVNEAKQARDGIAKYGAGVDSLGRQVTIVNERWASQNSKVQQLQRQLDLAGASGFWDRAKAGLNVGGLINFANGLTQITNGLQSASIIIGQVIGSFNNLFNVVAKLQQFELTFKAIGATQGETALAFEESSRIALGLGVNIDTVRDAFQQLTPVVLAIGGSINSVSQVTEALSSRFVAFGLSADKSRRVLNGVIQAFGKGKLMAEELTQQISEADPAFRTDLARAIGVSVKELNQLVKDGEITSRVLLDILPKLSKSSFLFGKLGSSAQSAADALRNASRQNRESGTGITVTLEQVQQQFQNLNTINLQNLGKALEPLLFSILEVTAVVTDLSTTLINSEGFKTFAEFINNLATQFSGTIRTIGVFVTAIIEIVGAVASAINAVDNFLAQFLKFRPIVGALAALITGKLIVALIGLSVKGAAGLAILGIKALAASTAAFSVGGLGGLARALTGSLLGFAGFKKATLDQIRDNLAAVASTKARTAALTQLRAVEVSGGLTAGFGPAALEAAGRRAAIRQAEQQVAASRRVADANLAVGATSGVAGAQLGKIGTGAAAAAGGLGLLGRLGGLLLNPWTILAATIGIFIFGLIQQNKETLKATSGLERFKTGFDGIQERTNKAIDALNGASTSSENFRTRLEALQKTSEKEFKIKVGLSSQIKEGNEIFQRVQGVVEKAQNSVKDYSSELDKSGAAGEKAAQRISAAEAANQLALDITRQKREELFDRATKNGQKISQDNAKQLSSYQAVIEKLETQRDRIQQIKKEAAGKGINVEVTIENKAQTTLDEIKAKSESLQAQILLEADPDKFNELQEKLTGLENRLAFLKADRIQLKIDLQFKVDQASVQDALNISQAVSENLRSQSELRSAIFSIDTAGLDAREQTAQKELDALKEAEASKEKIKTKENEIKAIQEQKRQIEAASIEAQLRALPAINESELNSLKLTQQLADLEAERLRLSNQRLINAAKIALLEVEESARRAEDRGDIDKAERLKKEAEIQKQQIGLLEKERDSLIASADARERINGLQQETLENQQEAKRLGLEAQLTGLKGASDRRLESEKNITKEYGNQSGALRGVGNEIESLRNTASGLGRGTDRYQENILSVEDSQKIAAANATELLRAYVLAADATAEIADNLDRAAAQRSAGFQVNYVRGLWTGGPTRAGQVYQVNELGREGFLSAGGTLSAINRPKNALWKAPSSGMVVPAHIMQALDIPKAGVNINRSAPAMHGKDDGTRRLSRVLQAVLTNRQNPSEGINELASVQAHQAKQIGKLSRAVSDLARKDWNVNVGLKVKDDAAYLSALNHRL